ncbi:MAG: orotidine-5-phosphate decarboxylase [Bacteroidota bacterium]|jgi:orotidine-5'-phosphate decarboxylase
MNRKKLAAIIQERKSLLCVGLDIDVNKIPAGVSPLEFNKAIVDATRDLAVAFKPNLAFYECMGKEGWTLFEETVKYIGKDHLIIADAKRGDIGNTSRYYAQTFFETYACDAVTIAPYMGEDSITPFLGFEDKWAIILGLTSNKGSHDFQMLSTGDEKLYQHVIRQTALWGSDENMMFVVGATQNSELKDIRKIIPNHFLLVPGVGAQGGSLEEVLNAGMTEDGGLLINASRSILYASSGSDFALAAREEAMRMQKVMALYLS